VQNNNWCGMVHLMLTKDKKISGIFILNIHMIPYEQTVYQFSFKKNKLPTSKAQLFEIQTRDP
jgi:hypothetical protein